MPWTGPCMKWTERYQAIARLGVRDVSAYNQKMSSFKGHIPSIFADLEPLPYLVIVIDELAGFDDDGFQGGRIEHCAPGSTLPGRPAST